MQLVFLHGFTQTHHSWHRAAAAIYQRVDPATSQIFIDLPGHGLNPEATAPTGDAAADIADAIGPGIYIGYSMGGRYALHAALRRPRCVQRLILIGATPGIDDTAARAERAAADDALAERITTIGVDAFLDDWLSMPMFDSLTDAAADREHRRRNTAAGLAAALRAAGTGRQRSLWPALPDIDVPVLAIAGERDDKFTDIGRRMTDALPNGTLLIVPDSGHAAHLENPTAVADEIAAWIQ